MDAPSTSRNAYARRLLLPANAPPPPIPPRLRSRFLQLRVSPPKPAAPQWLDGDEFALARSSSTSQTRGMVPPRRSGYPQATGPPVILTYTPKPPPPPPQEPRPHPPQDSANRSPSNVDTAARHPSSGPPPKHQGSEHTCRDDTPCSVCGQPTRYAPRT